MTNTQRIALLDQLSTCGYNKTMPNGEERYVRPPVHVRGGYYSFDKGHGNYNHWLVDKSGFSVSDDTDRDNIDFRIQQLAEIWLTNNNRQ